MVCKDYKIELKLKFFFPNKCKQLPEFTCFYVYNNVTICYYIFLEAIQLPYCIIHKHLIIHFFINDLLLFKFLQAFGTYRAIQTKNNLFIFDNDDFDVFFKILLCFNTVLTMYIQLFRFP